MSPAANLPQSKRRSRPAASTKQSAETDWTRGPHDIRTADSMTASPRPIAWRTWLGAYWLPVHADPLEMATTSRSSTINASLSTPRKLMFTTCSRDRSRSPFTRCSTFDIAARNVSFTCAARSRRCLCSAAASPAAFPSPTTSATGSVPGRSPRSCPPPTANGLICRRSTLREDTRKAPTPCGP